MLRCSDAALILLRRTWGEVMAPSPISSFKVGTLAVEVYEDRNALGQAAAAVAASRLRELAKQHESIPVIFATGDSQRATLHALAAMPDVPWNQVIGFRMDEYVGLPEDHRASFSRYMRENLTSRVQLRRMYEIDGAEANAQKTCREYAELIRAHAPLLCLLGVGENGHLAFNDPAEALFDDPVDVKLVTLDLLCRQQQVNEGAFANVAEMPERAITITVPALFRVPELILSIPGPRKAQIVKRTLYDPISTACPATILRRHANTRLFLDRASAAELTSGSR
jgi:glucosamine-6-phosphate deaminase